MFHRHAWSDWIVTDRGDTINYSKKVGWYLVQERYCAKCGKTEMNEQASYGGNSPCYCIRQSTMAARFPSKDLRPAAKP